MSSRSMSVPRAGGCGWFDEQAVMVKHWLAWFPIQRSDRWFRISLAGKVVGLIEYL